MSLSPWDDKLFTSKSYDKSQLPAAASSIESIELGGAGKSGNGWILRVPRSVATTHFNSRCGQKQDVLVSVGDGSPSIVFRRRAAPCQPIDGGRPSSRSTPYTRAHARSSGELCCRAGNASARPRIGDGFSYQSRRSTTRRPRPGSGRFPVLLCRDASL